MFRASNECSERLIDVAPVGNPEALQQLLLRAIAREILSLKLQVDQTFRRLPSHDTRANSSSTISATAVGGRADIGCGEMLVLHRECVWKAVSLAGAVRVRVRTR